MPGWDSAPQAHSRVSNINFDIWIFRGDRINIQWKFAEERQSFFQLGVRSNVLYGHLTDLSVLVGFCTSSPQQGVKYQLLICSKTYQLKLVIICSTFCIMNIIIGHLCSCFCLVNLLGVLLWLFVLFFYFFIFLFLFFLIFLLNFVSSFL